MEKKQAKNWGKDPVKAEEPRITPANILRCLSSIAVGICMAHGCHDSAQFSQQREVKI